MYDFILPEHIWSTIDEPKKFENVPAVGSGPWVVTEQKPGEFVRLERNPNFWGTEIGLEPHVDVIIEKVFNDENSMAAALERGEIDFGFFDSANILNSLKTKPNVKTWGAQIPLFDELAFNSGSAFQTDKAGGFVPHGDGIHATSDPAFRRAVAEAIDKQTLVDKVYGGYAAAADSPVQPGATTGNWDPPPDEALNFDLEKAKADLTAAGYTDTDGDGVVNDPKTGENVVLRYYTRTSDQNTIKTAPFVKSWLEQIGVGVKVAAVSSGKLTTIIESGDYELFHWGWFPNPDPNYILGIFTCEQRAPEARRVRQQRQLSSATRIRPAVPAAAHRDQHEAARRHRPPDAADPVRAAAVHHARLHQLPGGLPDRSVHRLHHAAGGRGRPPGDMGGVLLHQSPAGDRRGGVRRQERGDPGLGVDRDRRWAGRCRRRHNPGTAPDE